MARVLASLSASLLLLTACDGSPSPSDAGAPDAAPSDAGEGDAGSDAGAPASAICAELGLPVRAFDASATGTSWESVAGDFALDTLDGPFRLSERWSGCESYVFVAFATSDYGRGLWDGSPDLLFTEGPRNVHYFFTSWEATEPEARARVTAMRDKVEDGFEFLGIPEAERAFWRARVHYVTTPVRSIEGSVGELVRGSAIVLNAFAITRQQRFDPVGSLMSIRAGGFRPDLGMARFVTPYFDYLHDLDARLEAEAAVTVVDLVRDELTALRTIDRRVTLPTASAMAAFDTLEIDLEEVCTLRPDECSEWDRNAYVFVCEDEDCAVADELVRWITPYSRPGRLRWVMDASPLLGLLRDGGARTFRVVLGPDWERATERTVSASLRLSTRGGRPRAVGAEIAFRGGTFDGAYNDGRAPFRFTAPADTTRTELVVIVSGHGQEPPNNCAEWCDHHHDFAVDGENVAAIAFPGEAGRANGCAALTGDGVPPGQWGNWSPLRAGWCPGLPVETRRFELSGVTPGVEHVLEYAGSFAGGAPPGGHIDLSAYVVYYR